ncbi:MAG: hypothetical protein E6J90_23550 [Deltaproteobacteria bacterium]|nr:MAG: hypothetical protein E6J91_42820 [Deltaproteobacteria bacterium]TMQ16580.1 MAG: hypothetical protein E6J90_23550 [Deltaproteobacteria bacterium]
MLSRSRFALLAALSLVSCRDADGSQKVELRPAPVTPSANAAKPVEDLGPHPADDRGGNQPLPDDRKDSKKGDREDSEWVPQEFKAGMSRWKDAGVYVDGKPLGFLTWGEMPIGCKVSWLRDKVSAEKHSGTNEPGWKWARKRYYKFNDYLKAIGVDIRKVKELHVYGPKPTQTLIVTGRDLQSPAANDFWFWFGANTSGKPIPHAPENFGNGRTADKISSVMVYIDKKPPTLNENEGMFLDGVEQTGVPYYGEPIRGGVRVYLDDKLATIIKRQELDPKQATKGADGEPRWRLAEFFAGHGVDVKRAVEMWVIRGDQRAEKFSAAELATMTFEASSQSKGGVSLGEKGVIANALALHSRHLKPEDMPLPEQPDE